jgi:2-polyprenyl-3-methyl-5-hydroxy-6-metoxy-1,4-benzoquinol methylase
MKDRKVYHEGSDFQFEHPELLLGAPTSYSMTHDPKHICFVLARYKFCAKMLAGRKSVMEFGSGDGIGLPLLAKEVGRLHCVDWDERHLESIGRRLLPHFPNVSLHHLDLNKQRAPFKVDAAFSIDVIEHLDPRKEARFFENLLASLPRDGVLVTGTPNASASAYASPCSAVQHINLKTHDGLRKLMEKYFRNVFMFGMNDEVLHTGYGPMCHYLWSVAAGKR